MLFAVRVSVNNSLYDTPYSIDGGQGLEGMTYRTLDRQPLG